MSHHFPEALQSNIFYQLRDTARALGVRAFVIGGWVRDYLLNRGFGPEGGTLPLLRPDIDIVVEGRGIEMAEAFADRLGIEKVAVFANFGTAAVHTAEHEIEFVGARRESYRRNSRKPIVEDGTLEDDQLRRDFTINALSLSLNPEDYGVLHDPFDGLADLNAGVIRTPTDPQVTFDDDPLRMLRAIRFAARLKFEIEDRTYAAIKKNATRLNIVSQERITDELQKMLITSQPPSQAFYKLFETGLLSTILPELAAMAGIDFVDGRGHKDNFKHTLKVLDNVAEASESRDAETQLWLRWVALLHDIAKPLTKRYERGAGWTFHGHEDKGARMVPKLFRRMKLPLDERMRYVQKLVKLHQRPIALVSAEVTDSAIRRLVVDAGEDLEDLLLFCRCDITSRNPGKVRRFLRNYDELARRIREVEERDQLRNWQPPVDGKMIMDTFNLKPSRTVGLIKNEIREAILEGEIPNDREAALAFMHKVAQKYLKS